MAEYTSVANVIATIPFIGSITTLSSEQLHTLFILPSEARVNAAISKLYTVPVAGVPPLLEHVSREIACYYVLSRRVYPGEKATKSEWPDRFKEAIDLLTAIAEGKMPLLTGSGTAVDQNPSGVGVAWSNTMDYTPTFLDDANEWSSSIDEMKLEDIDASRT